MQSKSPLIKISPQSSHLIISQFPSSIVVHHPCSSKFISHFISQYFLHKVREIHIPSHPRAARQGPFEPVQFPFPVPVPIPPQSARSRYSIHSIPIPPTPNPSESRPSRNAQDHHQSPPPRFSPAPSLSKQRSHNKTSALRLTSNREPRIVHLCHSPISREKVRRKRRAR